MSITGVEFTNKYFMFTTNDNKKLCYRTKENAFYSVNREEFLDIIRELDEFVESPTFTEWLEKNSRLVLGTIKSNLLRNRSEIDTIYEMPAEQLVRYKNPILLYNAKLLKTLTNLAIDELMIEDIIS